MPVLSGMEIVEQLRAAHWRIPIILMTAFGDEATRDRARSLDALLFDKTSTTCVPRSACLLRRGPEKGT